MVVHVSSPVGTPLPAPVPLLLRHPHRLLHFPTRHVTPRSPPRHLRFLTPPASTSQGHTSHTSLSHDGSPPHHHPHHHHAHHHAHAQHDQTQAHHPHRLLAGAAAAAPVKTVSVLVSQSQYQMMKVLSLPTYGKLALMVVCTAPIVFFGAALYSAVGKKEWPQALSKAFYTVTDAPDYTEEEDSKAAAHVLLMLHMMGLLTFASIIGILSNDVASAVETLNKGNYNLIESKHTVLVGWNKHTISLLKQILVAQKERQGGSFRMPVVVLADRDKEEMDAELEDELGKEVLGSTVITRSGNPLRLSDMERVAAGQAGNVVVMSPEDDELPPGTKLAVVLSNLNGLSTTKQNIILESFGDRDDLRDTAAEVLVQEMSLSNNITTVQGLQNMQDLLAQCSIQPGLSHVLNQLTTQSEGCEFYIKHLPSLEGRSFRDARRSFLRATLCGLFDGAGVLKLNPEEWTLIGPEDTLLFLATDDNQLMPVPDTVHPTPVELSEHKTGGVGKNIFVLSLAPSVNSLVDSVHKFAPPGSKVTVFSQEAVTSRSRSGGTTRYLTGNIGSTLALVEAGVCEADSVIIHNMKEGVEDCVLDAQVVASVLQLQGALVQSKHPQRTQPLGVVCCIADPDTTTILTQVANLLSVHSTRGPRVVLDVIDTSHILGGILTQIGSEPLLQSVFAELLDSADGNEVYMRDASLYSIAQGVQYKWAQAQEAVRARGDLLIGVTTRSGETRLALPRDADIKLAEGDTLVVLGRWLR